MGYVSRRGISRMEIRNGTIIAFMLDDKQCFSSLGNS
jgi:hypothetical protein